MSGPRLSLSVPEKVCAAVHGREGRSCTALCWVWARLLGCPEAWLTGSSCRAKSSSPPMPAGPHASRGRDRLVRQTDTQTGRKLQKNNISEFTTIKFNIRKFEGYTHVYTNSLHHLVSKSSSILLRTVLQARNRFVKVSALENITVPCTQKGISSCKY